MRSRRKIPLTAKTASFRGCSILFVHPRSCSCLFIYLSVCARPLRDWVHRSKPRIRETDRSAAARTLLCDGSANSIWRFPRYLNPVTEQRTSRHRRHSAEIDRGELLFVTALSRCRTCTRRVCGDPPWATAALVSSVFPFLSDRQDYPNEFQAPRRASRNLRGSKNSEKLWHEAASHRDTCSLSRWSWLKNFKTISRQKKTVLFFINFFLFIDKCYYRQVCTWSYGIQKNYSFDWCRLYELELDRNKYLFNLRGLP